MTLLRVSLAYLRAKPLNTFLNIVLMAMGVATIVVLLSAASQLEARMARDARGIDLVVGAKGSPLQLVLAGVYHLDVPPGNVPLIAVQSLANHRFVKRVVPLALGDTYRGYRIVGTTWAYTAFYSGVLAQGREWTAPLEAVMGSEVAAAHGLKVGDSIAGSHGLGEAGGSHESTPYKIVGVLAHSGTVLDRLVLTAVESVWLQHIAPAPDESPAQILNALRDDEREVTVGLIQYATPLAAASLPREINASPSLQAASPAVETARLFTLLGVGLDTLRAFGVLLMFAAGLSIFIALYNALEERRYDLAVMRMMGARRSVLVQLVMIEGLIVALAGALTGLLLGHIATELLGWALAARKQPSITGWRWADEEWFIIFAAIAIGLAAALVPAWRARGRDVAQTLSER